MKKKAKDLAKGETFLIAGEEVTVETIEVSNIGKQGTAKCRIVAKRKNSETVTLIRPAEYPIETK